jgi:hypothetical protein
VIDVFSKYAWAVPIKKKDAQSVTDAYASILRERKPLKIQTDKGKEFMNARFKRMLDENDVRFYVSQNADIKASVVERFNRTLKTKIWKYFTHNNTFNYANVLDDLLHSYNNTHHRTIDRAPSSVKRKDVDALHAKMFPLATRVVPAKFKVGARVRISKTRRVFDKGYLPNWTVELFTVTKVLDTNPPTYKLRDYDGEEIDGTFTRRNYNQWRKKTTFTESRKF